MTDHANGHQAVLVGRYVVIARIEASTQFGGVVGQAFDIEGLFGSIGAVDTHCESRKRRTGHPVV